VLIEATKPEQLADNLKTVEWKLAAEELKTLDEFSAPPRPYPHWMLDFTDRDRISPEGLLT
jgi:diketogulonate reductase-like aldo/keto reductase